MKYSDCCGWPCDGVEGAEETGICGQCGEHCTYEDDDDDEDDEDEAPFRSLGWGNGWPAGTMPVELRECQAKGHQMLESKMPCGGWLARCPICRLEYMYDSGD